MRGAVWDGKRLHVTDELEVRDPGPGEARVRILASGICHSDISMMDYNRRPTPIILGHEGAGVVDCLGPGVEGIRIGEPVCISARTPCSECHNCKAGRQAACPEAWGHGNPQPFRWKGEPTYSMANMSSFAQLTTVKASQLFKSEGLPPEQAALIGCAVSTGVGAIRKLGQVRPGDVVVVFGIGGVGVNALQAAKAAGASRILAIDISENKRRVAEQFGATDFFKVDMSDDGEQLLSRIANYLPPVDVAIEASGALEAMDAAVSLPGRGGTCVLVGQPRPGTKVSFDALQFTLGRQIVATLNGGIDPELEFDALIDEVRTGQLDVASQISRIWALDDIEEAVGALRAGAVTRAVLNMA